MKIIISAYGHARTRTCWWLLVELEDDSLRVAVVGVTQTQLVALQAEEEAEVVGLEP